MNRVINIKNNSYKDLDLESLLFAIKYFDDIKDGEINITTLKPLPNTCTLMEIRRKYINMLHDSKEFKDFSQFALEPNETFYEFYHILSSFFSQIIHCDGALFKLTNHTGSPKFLKFLQGYCKAPVLIDYEKGTIYALIMQPSDYESMIKDHKNLFKKPLPNYEFVASI